LLEDFQKKIMECYILRYNLIVLSPSIGGTDHGLYLGWGMNRLKLNVATCALGAYICVKCVSLSFQNFSFIGRALRSFQEEPNFENWQYKSSINTNYMKTKTM